MEIKNAIWCFTQCKISTSKLLQFDEQVIKLSSKGPRKWSNALKQNEKNQFPFLFQMKTLSKPKKMDDSFKTMQNSIKEKQGASTYHRDRNMNQKLRVLGSSMATHKKMDKMAISEALKWEFQKSDKDPDAKKCRESQISKKNYYFFEIFFDFF